MAFTQTEQLSFLEAEKPDKKIKNDDWEWGTFKDSLRAPIHRWFTYPAGFSYKAVESSFRLNGIKEGDTVYDPFMGSGTTNLTAKKLGINSYGVEAHPFVFRITKAKLNWEIRPGDVIEVTRKINAYVEHQKKLIRGDYRKLLRTEFPELVLKCYEDRTLLDLFLIRNYVTKKVSNQRMADFLFVGLTRLLREVASVATGWPYIAPKKPKTSSLKKHAATEYSRLLLEMVGDVRKMIAQSNPSYLSSSHRIFNHDSKNTRDLIPSNSVDHIFTSPPYLNNFDYADRTRLELYFFGEAKTWADISENVRTKLMTSATTQIFRTDKRYELSDDLLKKCPQVHTFLKASVGKLAMLRLNKGGKKSYDLMVAGYFNDIYKIIEDCFRVLKRGKKAIFVLGDSAPYGVHIPTDELIGKIGVAVGFSDFKINVLRTRGGKWAANPQRHTVKLRESIVTLTKK